MKTKNRKTFGLILSILFVINFLSVFQLKAQPLVFDSVSISHNICFGTCNGSIDLEIDSGVPPYYYFWSNGEATQDIDSLCSGIYTVTVYDSTSFLSPVLPWSVLTTAANHTILLKPSLMQINSGLLQNGDYIGVFYDSLGSFACGGYTEWTGNTTYVTAWGADVGNDGFAIGESFNWKLWKAFDGQVTNLSVTYHTSNFPNQGSYATNGMSAIAQLSGNYTPNPNFNYLLLDFEVTSPPQISIVSSLSNYAGFNTSAIGASDGFIDITAYWGNTPYTFLWSNGETSEDISGLLSGPYSVIVLDADSCSQSESFFLNQPIVVASVIEHTNCGNSCEGAIAVSVMGGATPYSYAWSNSASVDSITDLCQGNYELTISDNSIPPIDTVFQFTMAGPPPLVLTALLSDYNGHGVSALGASDGFIDITVSGGNSPYIFQWSGGETTEDLMNIPAGNYTVTVLDDDSCSISESFFLIEPMVATSTIYDTNCGNSCNGAISVSVMGGLSPYLFLWGNAASSDSIGSLCQGNYGLILMNNSTPPLVTVFLFTVSGPPVLVLTAQQSDYGGSGVSTMGASDGWIDISITGGTPPYIFHWSGGETAEDLMNIPAGNYAVTVLDADSCSITESFLVNEMMGFSGTVINATCFGTCDGEIALSIYGGIPPFTFYWSNGETSQNLSNLCAGTYYVTVIDSIWGNSSDTFVVSGPDQILVTSQVSDYSGYGVSSSGASDGWIDITVSGGSPPYQFSWSTGNSTEDISNIPAGNYLLTVTDSTSCQQSFSFNLIPAPYNPALITSGTSTNIDCFGSCSGSIDLLISGGNPWYTFLWNDGASIQNRTNLCAGNYSVVIYDSPPNATGQAFNWSYNISWSNHTIAIPFGTVLVNGAAPDIGDVIGVFYDDNGVLECGGYFPYNGGTIIITSWVHDTGLGGGQNGFETGDDFHWKLWRSADSIEVNMLATYSTSQINQGTFQHNGLSAINSLNGYYNLQGNQQTQLLNFTIDQPDSIALNAVVVNVDTITNQSGTIDINPGGGISPYSFIWSTGDTIEDISLLDTGWYTLTLTDANLCEAVEEFYVGIEIYLPLLITDTLNHVSCYGDNDGSINVSISGGISPYSFEWSNGETNQNLENLYVGTYVLTVTDSLNSSIIDTFEIMSPAEIIISSIISNYNGYGVSAWGASDGFIDITVSGGTSPYTYLWSGGITTEDLTNIPAGQYELLVSDSNYCDALEIFELINPPPDPILATGAVENVSCWGVCDGTIEITASGGILPLNFSWSNGETTQVADNLCAGMYSLTVSDIDSSLVMSFEITQPDTISAEFVISMVDPVTGTGGSIDATISGGTSPYSYQWSNGDTVEDLLQADYGNYQLSVTDSSLCQNNFEVFVDFSILPGWDIFPNQNQHTIEIPLNANLLLNGQNLDNNDFIGVFYDSSGSVRCGGYTVWQNQAVNLTAYGDQIGTTNQEGFSTGEEFAWKIWDASENTVHDAVAVYLPGYANQQYFALSGSSGIDSLYTNSISGTVSTTTKSNLDLGMVVVFEATPLGYYAVGKGLVQNGSYHVTGLKKGDYICYAIPQPGNDWGIPGYYTTRDNWQGASWVHAHANTTGIDIVLDPVLPYATGAASISGSIMVGDDASYNPDIFDNEWFPPSTKNDDVPARNIPILLYDSLQNAIDFRLTNVQGFFAYENLEYGTYFVKVEKAGLQAEHVEVVLDAGNPVSGDINFQLNSGQVISIQSVSQINRIFIYPNPARDKLNVVLPSDFRRINSLEIFSQLGTIQGGRFSSEKTRQNCLQVDLSGLVTGIYLLKLSSDKNVVVAKFIKQ